MGFVEGDDIFSGDVDVVVTDGFTGNVALKTMEGVAGLIAERLRQEFQMSASGSPRRTGRPRRCCAALPRDSIRAATTAPAWSDSAGIVVKSHGRADGVAFARAIGTAALAARRDSTAHIAQALQGQGG